MVSWLLQAAVSFAVPPAFAVLVLRRPASKVYRAWAITSGMNVVTEGLIVRSWPYAAGAAVSLLVALLLWWWSRRRRKRAAKLLGAKARALREKLVRNMPRWSPRLQPQGARA